MFTGFEISAVVREARSLLLHVHTYNSITKNFFMPRWFMTQDKLRAKHLRTHTQKHLLLNRELRLIISKTENARPLNQ